MKLFDETKAGAKLLVLLPAIAIVSVPIMAWVLITRLFEEPLTPADVAVVLRKSLEGASDAEDEMDNLTSMKIADPRLNDIKKQLVSFPFSDWESPEARRALQDMLARVEAMPARPTS